MKRLYFVFCLCSLMSIKNIFQIFYMMELTELTELTKYYVTTFCCGSKYYPIKDTWHDRVNAKCKNAEIKIFEDFHFGILDNSSFETNFTHIWMIRLKHNIDLLLQNDKPIVMCDLDVIIEKDIQPLVELPFDIIISTEIGGDKSYPQECSRVLGFGVCCGFMILKPSSKKVILQIFENMKSKKYDTCDDQVNFMNYIVNNYYTIKEESIILDNKKYYNKIITIDDIKICVLDFNIITRDPIKNDGQFANHINIDNVGGVYNFLRYFNEKLEKLPLTCRCGKQHLGDNNACKHIEMRNNPHLYK